MVTPIHRFQFIKSARGLRYTRSPSGQHAKIHSRCSPPIHHNGASDTAEVERPLEIITPGDGPTTRNKPPPTFGIKCGVCVFLLIVIIFFTSTPLLFYCLFLAILLITAGMISVCNAFKSSNASSDTPVEAAVQMEPEQETEKSYSQHSSSALSHISAEMPPPYHIAVML